MEKVASGTSTDGVKMSNVFDNIWEPKTSVSVACRELLRLLYLPGEYAQHTTLLLLLTT